MDNNRRKEIPSPWCYIYGEFPPVQVELLTIPNNLPAYLVKMLECSRPLFSQYLAKAINLSRTGDIDEWLATAFHLISGTKGSFSTSHGRLGQIRLFQNAHHNFYISQSKNSQMH